MLRVKRKTKRLANKSVWWFVVHGSESDLTLLEKSWGKIQSQTLWTLQECFMPAASKPALVSVDANSQHKLDAGETKQPVICIPSVKAKTRNNVPWMNHSIAKAIKQRDVLFRTTYQLSDLKKYKLQRNKVV